MSASGFFRIKKLKGPGKVLVASRHNKRAIQAENGAARHIEPQRMHLNLSLHGPNAPELVAQAAKSLMAAAGIKAPAKNAVVALELVFSLPPDTAIPIEAFFRECLGWAVQHFGGLDNILSADVHVDESAPHLHVLILPLVSGRMNGSAMFGNRQRLQFLQNDFHGAIAGRYGLAKAPARLQGQAKEKTAHAVIERLRCTNDKAQLSAIWPMLRDLIDRDPAPFAQTLGIDIAAGPAKKMRTMAEIFTSKGKGSNVRPKPIGIDARTSPIGNDGMEKDRTLSCVGFALEAAPLTAGQQATDGRMIERTMTFSNGRKTI